MNFTRIVTRSGLPSIAPRTPQSTVSPTVRPKHDDAAGVLRGAGHLHAGSTSCNLSDLHRRRHVRDDGTIHATPRMQEKRKPATALMDMVTRPSRIISVQPTAACLKLRDIWMRALADPSYELSTDELSTVLFLTGGIDDCDLISDFASVTDRTGNAAERRRVLQDIVRYTGTDPYTMEVQTEFRMVRPDEQVEVPPILYHLRAPGNGPELVTMRLAPVHTELMDEFFQACTHSSLQLRFPASKIEDESFSREMTRRLLIDGFSQRAGVMVTLAPGGAIYALADWKRVVPSGLRERFAAGKGDIADEPTVEISVIVRDDQQRQGLGPVLLTKAVDQARKGGTRQLVAITVADNTSIRRVLERCGMVFCGQREDADRTLVLYRAGIDDFKV